MTDPCNSLLRRSLPWITVAMMSVSIGAAPAPSEPSATALKAAFLYNFAKFTEWPADMLAPGQRLFVCVIDAKVVADALKQIIQGRAVDGHELIVLVVKPDEPIRSCHLLYVGGRDAKRSSQILDTLKGSAVFSVGESDNFAESGGVAQLILENEKMRFAVNVASVHRARLQVSSKLLTLATIVKDEYDAHP